jgi:hypothetical protein
MITAEEFFMKFKNTHSPVNHHLALIEFAKLHVEEALKEASEKVEHLWDNNENKLFDIDKNSILISYSLENIK